MNRVNQYTKVDRLPFGAMNIEEYAANLGVSKNAIYNTWRRKGKLDGYVIVVFKGFNFVVEEGCKDK